MNFAAHFCCFFDSTSFSLADLIFIFQQTFCILKRILVLKDRTSQGFPQQQIYLCRTIFKGQFLEQTLSVIKSIPLYFQEQYFIDEEMTGKKESQQRLGFWKWKVLKNTYQRIRRFTQKIILQKIKNFAKFCGLLKPYCKYHCFHDCIDSSQFPPRSVPPLKILSPSFSCCLIKNSKSGPPTFFGKNTKKSIAFETYTSEHNKFTQRLTECTRCNRKIV